MYADVYVVCIYNQMYMLCVYISRPEVEMGVFYWAIPFILKQSHTDPGAQELTEVDDQ